MQPIVFLLLGTFASVGLAELVNSPPVASNPAKAPSSRIIDVKNLVDLTEYADETPSDLPSLSLAGIKVEEKQPSPRFLNSLLSPLLRGSLRYDYDGFDSPEDYNDIVRQGQPNDSGEPEPFDYGSVEQAPPPPPPPPMDNQVGLNRVSRPFRRPTGFGGYGGGGYGGGGYGSPSGYGGYGGGGYGGGYGGGRPASPHRGGHRGNRGGNRTGNRRPQRNNKRIPGRRPSFMGKQPTAEPFVTQEIGPDPVDFLEPAVAQEPAANQTSPQEQPQDVQEPTVV